LLIPLPLAGFGLYQRGAEVQGAANPIPFIHSFLGPFPKLHFRSLPSQSHLNLNLILTYIHIYDLRFCFIRFTSISSGHHRCRSALDATLHSVTNLIAHPGSPLSFIAFQFTFTMRRQNRSCDQCRKAKRACDAPSLWDIQRNPERVRNGADSASGASLAEEHLGELRLSFTGFSNICFLFPFPSSRLFPMSTTLTGGPMKLDR
jgi:hypothetical protein